MRKTEFSFEALIGSWEIPRELNPQMMVSPTPDIFHFSKDGTYIWEMAETSTGIGRTHLAKPKAFEVGKGRLILTLSPGSRNNLEFHETDDDLICVSAQDGKLWFLRRLLHAEPFMMGFIDDTGLFQRL